MSKKNHSADTGDTAKKEKVKKAAAKKPSLPPKGVSPDDFDKQKKGRKNEGKKTAKTRSAPAAQKKSGRLPPELSILGNTVYQKTEFERELLEQRLASAAGEKQTDRAASEKPAKQGKKDTRRKAKSLDDFDFDYLLSPTSIADMEEGGKPKDRKASKPAQSAQGTQKKKNRVSSPAKTAGDAPSGYRSNHKPVKRTPVRIIPLGGLNEIGKNMTAFECGSDMFIVDCGLAFPDSDMPGVDMVIPDFTYVEQNRDKVRGIIITHGHEDHIGGLAYLLMRLRMPVYATALTIALIEGKLKEHGLPLSDLNKITPGQTVKLGCMAVEFIRVNHSIPDSVGLAIHTPAGVIVHTGDFKVDFTPIDGEIIDLARFGELGNKGVLALMADSTNAERPGHTPSERKVGETFEKLFARADGKRIIIATFASNIHRIQQIVDNAVTNGRKVAVFGRSMLNAISAATQLGYLKVPDDIFIDVDAMNKYPPDKICLITTGSQGEPMSALTRMAMGEHRSVTITPSDYIIISANPIPGNEKFVTRVVNELLRAGAEVVYEAMYDVHVSGHACQEELKLIQALTRPRFFIPVHGEYKHLKKHAGLALSMGMPANNVFICSIGDVIETDGVDMKVTGKVQAGRVLVDGLGVGDVGSVVLRDRKHLAEDGLMVVVVTIESETGTLVAGPDILSRGFVYVRENEEMMDEARKLLVDTLDSCLGSNMHDWNAIKTSMKNAVSDFIFRRTGRKPMILPIIEEI